MHSRPRAARPRARAAAVGLVVLAALGVAAPATAAPIARTPSTTAAATPLTERQALAQAESTGVPVAVSSATTETDSLTANPDGHLTLTRTAMPVRRLVGGAWRNLDATLHRNPDGSIGPVLASSDLSLSGGGSGPLATLSGSGHRLALSLPMALPAPSLSGPAATYHDVLPGVDLVATATDQGGFSEVVVVNSAAAVTDPRIATLTLATQATGMTLRADTAGNISGVDRLGRVVVSAPAPQMWDSGSTAPGAAAKARAAADPADGSALPPDSSPAGPGADAQTAGMGVQVTSAAITLTPDPALMDSTDLTYPVYLDPSFVQPVVSNRYSGWSTINKSLATDNFWDSTPDPHPAKDMQAGTPDGSNFVSRSLINFPIAVSTLGTATNVSKATLQVNEDWAYSCAPRPIDLYAPAQTLSSSNATWNSWPDSKLGSEVTGLNVAYGYPGCSAQNIAFNVLAPVRSAISAKKTTQTFLLKAADESDKLSWKEFTHPSASVGPFLTIDYNHAPGTPTALKTSPATDCAGTTTVGLGPISLTATVADPDGGTVGATFKLINHSTGATVQASDPQVTHATSGQPVSFALDQSKVLSSAAGKVTTFDWTASATDYSATSGVATCHFAFDPNSPGAPKLSPPPGDAAIGQPASFTASPPDSSSTNQAAAFLVQLNGAAPIRYPATAGTATFTVTPTRLANTLTVTSISATGANIGQAGNLIFPAAAASTPATDQDLTGDGVPDLLATGGPSTALPPGLWTAPGDPARGINPGPVDLGIYGDGTTGDDLPTDFNGTRAISGAFDPGAGGLQDILIYQPQGAANEGGGEILDGNGDGSPIDPSSGQETTIAPTSLDDQSDDYPQPVAPIQLVDAGNTSGRGNPYPDLIGIGGDPTDGYSLWFYNAMFEAGKFTNPNPLIRLATPTGGTDWNTWTLASAQIGGQTDLYLWQQSSGALYLWSNLAYDGDAGTLTYTPTTLGTWNAGSSINIQAADLDGNHTPDLWAVTTTGTATAWLNNSTGLTAQPAQTLTAPAHTWLFNDSSSGIATNARDITGTYTAHATTGTASWKTGDLFDPDIVFDPATRSAMNTSNVVAANHDFTISFWARPTAYNGTVISQDGANGSFFRIWPSSDTTWHFSMEKTDVPLTSATWDEAKSPANTATLGAWYHITATYQTATKTMNVYIGNTLAGTATRTGTLQPPAESSTIKTQFGTMKIGTTWGNFYQGGIADIQTWNTATPPVLN